MSDKQDPDNATASFAGHVRSNSDRGTRSLAPASDSLPSLLDVFSIAFPELDEGTTYTKGKYTPGPRAMRLYYRGVRARFYNESPENAALVDAEFLRFLNAVKAEALREAAEYAETHVADSTIGGKWVAPLHSIFWLQRRADEIEGAS